MLLLCGAISSLYVLRNRAYMPLQAAGAEDNLHGQETRSNFGVDTSLMALHDYGVFSPKILGINP
jgi:hypothetical protein